MKRMKMIAVNTSLGTNFLLSAPRDVSIAELRDLIKEEHSSCFPDHGNIEISALTVEYDGKQYHITDSLLVGQVFKKGWSRIHAEVSSGVLRNNPGDTRGKNLCDNLDVPRAEFPEAEPDTKCQGLSGRKQDSRKKMAVSCPITSICHTKDTEDIGLGNFTQKNGFLAQKSFGCSLLFIEGPYTQPLSGTNMSTLVTFGRAMIENKINHQKAKTDAQKGSTWSGENLSERFQECKQTLDCREQFGKTKCTWGVQQSTSEKCLQAEDNRKQERFLGHNPKGLHGETVLGCPSAADGAMLDERMGILFTEAEASSPKVNGFKLSVDVEQNDHVHSDGKLPNGCCSAEIVDKCYSGNGDDGKLNKRALDDSSSEHETASRLNSKSVERKEEQINSQNCCKIPSQESCQQSVNSEHSNVIEYLLLKKNWSSPTKSDSEWGNETDTVREKMFLLNADVLTGHTTAVRDSLQNDAAQERGLGNSSGHFVTGNGHITPVPASASADMVPQTQDSQMGTQICVSAVKEVKEYETRELLKKLDGPSGNVIKETDSKPSGSASLTLQNGAEQNGSENTKSPLLMDHMCADGLNNLDKKSISRFILPKKHEKEKRRAELQIQALPVQEDICMVLGQDLAVDVPEQQINIEVDSGTIQPCNSSNNLLENHVTEINDPLKGNTEGLGPSENGSDNPPPHHSERQKMSLIKEGGCDTRVQSLGEDKDTVEMQMARSGSTNHDGDKRVREDESEYSETNCQNPDKGIRRKGSTCTPKNPEQISSQKNCMLGKEIVYMALDKLYRKKKKRKREQDNIEIRHHNNADMEGGTSQYGIALVDECASNCSHRQSMKFLARQKNWKDVTMETNGESADPNASLGKRVKKRKSKRKCKGSAHARNVENTSFKGNQDHNTVDTLCACTEKVANDIGVDLITRKNSLDVFEFNSQETGNKQWKNGFSARRKLGKVAEQLDRSCSKGTETVFDDDFTSTKRVRKTATRSATPKRSITLPSDKFIQSQNPVKEFSKENFGLSMIQQATKAVDDCLKESVIDHGVSLHNTNVEEATLQESIQTTGDRKLPCPVGCGRRYAGKTSAWYRHRQKCSGKCL